MRKPVIHCECYGYNNEDDGYLKVCGNYAEIIAMIKVIAKELCSNHMDPADIMLAVTEGISEARK